MDGPSIAEPCSVRVVQRVISIDPSIHPSIYLQAHLELGHKGANAQLDIVLRLAPISVWREPGRPVEHALAPDASQHRPALFVDLLPRPQLQAALRELDHPRLDPHSLDRQPQLAAGELGGPPRPHRVRRVHAVKAQPESREPTATACASPLLVSGEAASRPPTMRSCAVFAWLCPCLIRQSVSGCRPGRSRSSCRRKAKSLAARRTSGAIHRARNHGGGRRNHSAVTTAAAAAATPRRATNSLATIGGEQGGRTPLLDRLSEAARLLDRSLTLRVVRAISPLKWEGGGR